MLIVQAMCLVRAYLGELAKRFNNLMKQFKKSDKLLPEKRKKNNQLEWTKLMNNYKIIAEEIILNELIYNKNV